MFEEEEEDSGMSAVRYACMPSLVSLQLMRNRLHLAYLGRKLMKWSALATGRELRKIAMQLDLVYDSFAEDMRNAYMLLARGRYFCPIMNKMVIENVAEKASVTAKSTLRMVTGVKIPQYEIVESGVEPYEHLGIEKGGQQIHEAKVAWLELLKRLVLIVQLRVSFTLVELANKSATKRQNVLQKVVAPKTLATLRYIADELEEKEREDFYRLKKTMGVKQKLALGVAKKRQGTCNILGSQSEADKLTDISNSEIQETEFEVEETKENSSLSTDLASLSKTGTISTDTGNFSKNGSSEVTTSGMDVFLKLAVKLHQQTAEFKKENTKYISATKSVSQKPSKDSFRLTDTVLFPKTASENKFNYAEMYENNMIFSVETMKSEKNIGLRTAVSKAKVKIEARDEDKSEKEILTESLTETTLDLDLGLWETEYEEITQVIHVKKEDGTLIEEKRIIKKKKENKKPLHIRDVNKDKSYNKNISLTTSSKSIHYSVSKTIGSVTVKNRSTTCVKKHAASDTIMYLPAFAYTNARHCSSTACLNSTNANVSFHNIKSLFKGYDDIKIQDLSMNESHVSGIDLEVITNIYESASSSIFNSDDFNTN